MSVRLPALIILMFFSLFVHMAIGGGSGRSGDSSSNEIIGTEPNQRAAYLPFVRSVPIGRAIPDDQITGSDRSENLLRVFLERAPKCPERFDSDNDGWDDCKDNCPFAYNPGQADLNSDGIGDACEDWDGDGVANFEDNCINTPNAHQEDRDSDGIGDLCDDSLEGPIGPLPD